MNQNYGDLKALRVGVEKSSNKPVHKAQASIGLKKIKFDT